VVLQCGTSYFVVDPDLVPHAHKDEHGSIRRIGTGLPPCTRSNELSFGGLGLMQETEAAKEENDGGETVHRNRKYKVRLNSALALRYLNCTSVIVS
jgi:hypothetical protein